MFVNESFNLVCVVCGSDCGVEVKFGILREDIDLIGIKGEMIILFL